MSDHFANIWEKSKDSNLEKTFAKLSGLEKNPRAFRLEEFMQSIKKKCNDLSSA